MSDHLDSCLARIDALDDEIRAWVRVERSPRPRMDTGRLSGVTVGIKDIIDVAGVPTECGAAPFAHTTPVRDAEVVRRLRGAGAVVLGKTATTEFAYLAPAQTRNPWNLEHTPGGSSSGSAAAVASGMVSLALGTQTVGSILRPAAYCGIVGMKPSYGLVSTDGVYPVSRSLDHVGGFARSVDEMRALLEVLCGEVMIAEHAAVAGRIGIVRGFADDRLEPGFEVHLTELRAGPLAGFRFGDVEIGSRSAWFDPGLIILSAEAAMQHAESYRRHKGEYRRETAELIEQGLRIEEHELADARKALSQLRRSVTQIAGRFDALLMPSAPGTAPRGIESTGDSTFCAPATFAGLPSISLPTGLSDDGLPLAIQLIGQPGGDAGLLDLAERMELELKFREHTGNTRERISTVL